MRGGDHQESQQNPDSHTRFQGGIDLATGDGLKNALKCEYVIRGRGVGCAKSGTVGKKTSGTKRSWGAGGKGEVGRKAGVSEWLSFKR